MEWGAQLNLPGDVGNTALHHAAIMKRREIVAVLLNLGADITIKNDFGETALDCARNGGDTETELLLGKRASESH